MANVSLFIARRYLFSKKGHNAINIISMVSLLGVALTAMAMMCTMSVFNGFQHLIQQQFTAFDPELRIEPVKGKVLSCSKLYAALKDVEGVSAVSPMIEEQAMVQYNGRQQTVIVKGLDENATSTSNIVEALYGNGYFELHDQDGGIDYAIMGIGLASQLGAYNNSGDTLQIMMPVRSERINTANPLSSLRIEDLLTNGLVFSVGHSSYDNNYILTSNGFMRKITDYTEDQATALAIKCEGNVSSIKKSIAEKLGEDYRVLDREEQQSEVFRIMKIEKLITFLFLAFILLIASFNIIGSLSMLIIDKQRDIITLQNLGATRTMTRRIFAYEGMLITIIGATVGVLCGLLLCYLQQRYGFITLGDPDHQTAFAIDAYPVRTLFSDVIIIVSTVLVIGGLSVWLSTRKVR